jgi:hypothetical protein
VPPLTGLRFLFGFFPVFPHWATLFRPLRGSRKYTFESYFATLVNHRGGLRVIAVMVDANEMGLEDEIKEAVCWQ